MVRILLAYMASYGVSLLGNSITAIALPLLVLFTTGSALDAGIVAVAVAVPAAIAGIVLGSVIDLINRRTAAILANVISAVALALLPIIELTAGLNLGWFIAVAILSSIGDVPGITAREAMLPSVAQAAGISASRMVGTREAISAVSLLVGPAIAGFLVAALEPVTVMWFTAALSALAAILSFGIPSHATARPVAGGARDPETTRRPAVRSIFRGLMVIARSPLLRSLILLMLILGVVLAATQGLVLPVHFAFQDQAQYVGFVLSALAGGLLVGGTLFAVFSSRIPRLAWFVIGMTLVAAGFIIIAVLGPVWLILLGAAIIGLGGGSMNSVIGLTFIENVRDSERGRVLGAENALLTLIPGVGIGAAALMIEFGSLQMTTIVLATVWILAAAVSLLSRPLRGLGKASA